MLVDIDKIKFVKGEKESVNLISLDDILNKLRTGEVFQPIITSENYFIIDGRKRIAAYKHQGIKKIEIEIVNLDECESKLLKQIESQNVKLNWKRTAQVEIVNRLKRLVKIRGSNVFNGITYKDFIDVEVHITNKVMGIGRGSFRNADMIIDFCNRELIDALDDSSNGVNTIFKKAGFKRKKHINKRGTFIKSNSRGKEKNSNPIAKKCSICGDLYYSKSGDICIDCANSKKIYMVSMKKYKKEYVDKEFVSYVRKVKEYDRTKNN